MRVVSNASPIINLAWIKRFELLHHLFEEVILPHGVWREVVELGKGRPGSSEVVSAQWIRFEKPNNRELIHSLRQELDEGEAEAIALAQELEVELLLMDERLGRETANYFGLRVMGVIGILIESKQRGLIEHLKPELEALRDQAGFYIKPDLYARILEEQDAG